MHFTPSQFIQQFSVDSADDKLNQRVVRHSLNRQLAGYHLLAYFANQVVDLLDLDFVQFARNACQGFCHVRRV